ncbi:hypothetical protein LZ30DRAFT_742017 [Colletotrichum cereale]|nr:hypothetical protein LZ30DRAFT_742017 [Colletotrichum cereale]
MPYLYTQGASTGVFPIRHEHHAFLYNDVVLPALRGDGRGRPLLSHMPATYDIARQRDRVAGANVAAGRGGVVRYDLSPHFLPGIEARLAQEARDPAGSGSPVAAAFGGCFFALNGKNLKARFGGCRGADEVMAAFRKDMDTVVDPASPTMTRLVDVATEWHPGRPVLPRRQATTLLARRCCQLNTASFLFGDRDRTARDPGVDGDGDGNGADGRHAKPDAVGAALVGEVRGDVVCGAGPLVDDWAAGGAPVRGGTATWYPVFQLRDTSSVTVEAHARLRDLGLYYYQSYNVPKEVTNMVQNKAYTHDHLVNNGYQAAALTGLLGCDGTRAKSGADEMLRVHHAFVSASTDAARSGTQG